MVPKAMSDPGLVYPMNRLGSGCVVTSQLYGLIEVREIDPALVSSASEERLNSLSLELNRAGYEDDRVGAVLQLCDR